MTELQSVLPPAEDVEQQTITILPVTLGRFQHKEVETRFTITNTSKHTTRPLIATVYRMDDERIVGYIPSKTWWNRADGELCFLYYTSPTLPAAARPFGSKPCYAFTRIINHEDEVIDYPIEARILIDQVLIVDRMYYVFLFADEQARNVMATTWEGNPWSSEVPEAALYTGEV